MATYVAALPCPGTSMTGDLRADVSATIAGDLSGWTISFSLYLIATNSSGYPSSSSGNSAYLDLEGTRRVSWGAAFNFPSGHGAGYVIGLGSGSYFKAVTADGTGSVGAGFAFAEGGSPTIGNTSGSGTLTLPTIPRATQPTVSPSSGNTGSAFTIGHVPATSSFYHDVAYSLDGGGSYTNIATNVVGTTTTTTWTPPHTILPNTSSATVVIKVTTRSSSGGSIIGTKTVNLPLTVPASVKPTVSAVAWSDAQTSAPDIPTLMGGTGRFVQGWSKLIPTATSAGAGGSTVTGAAITVNGRTTSSGTAFGLPVDLSGSVPFSAVATDSRSRNSDPLVGTVPVAAYNFPSLPTPLVARTSDAGGSVPSPTGTYLAITPAASVSSLFFGSIEKNLLEWQVRIKPVGGSYSTVQAWTSATVSGNTWTTKFVAPGPYLSSNEYVVEVSIRDLFGKNGYNTGSTVKTLEIPVNSEAVFMDWSDGIGVGKYWTQGTIDSAGQLYQNNGKPVLDTDYAPAAASTTVSGIQQNATNAETITGTALDRTVTPAGLFAARSLPVQGRVPSSVVVGSGTASVAADGTVTFTGVSSLSLNDVFDGLGGDIYEAFLDIPTVSVALSPRIRLRNVGGDDSTGQFDSQILYGIISTTAAGAATAQNIFDLPVGNRAQHSGRILFTAPGRAMRTAIKSELWSGDASNANSGLLFRGGFHRATSAFTGFSVLTTTGTMTGTIKVVKVA